MATSTARLHAEITADDQASKVFKQVAGNVDKTKMSLEDAAKNAGIAGAAIAGAAIVAMKGWVDAANERIQGEQQLQAVLKSTNGAVGMSAQELINLAGQMQNVTTVSDDTVLAGENMLLTFTNIGKDVFPQTTQTMLDMATAMNNGATPSAEQLKGTAIQLGKALNDPKEGLAALGRVGVKFTEDQKKQIETLQKHNDLMGAQKIILAELNREFGGSAAQQAATFKGQMEQLNNTFGDLQEELGIMLMPVLLQFRDMLRGMMTWLQSLSPEMKQWIVNIGLGALAVGGLLMAIGALGVAIPALITGFTSVGTIVAFLATNPIGWLILALIAVATYMAAQGKTWNEVVLDMQSTWQVMVMAVVDKLHWLEEQWDSFLVTIGQMTPEAFEQIKKDHAAKMEGMNNDLAKLGEQYGEITREKYKAAKEAAENEVARQRDMVDMMTGDMKEAARRNLEKMKENYLKQFPDMRLGSSQELAKMRNDAEDATKKAADAAAKNTAEMNAKVVAAFKSSAGSALEWGQHLIANLSSGIWGKMPVLSTAIAGAQAIMNKIHQSYNPELPAQLWGEHFLENFAAGMKDSAPKVFAQTNEMKAALKAEYGSDGEISKLMKEWTKDKSIGEHFAQIAEQVKQEGQRISDEFTREKGDYDSLNIKVGQALTDLKKKHQDALDDINKKIQETKDKIQDLNDNYKINVQKEDTGVGQEVVKQQDLVESLKKQIADAQSKGDSTTDLQSQYDKEFAALQAFLNNSKGYEDEIAEARRRANLTDFERFIEDTNARKQALTEEYNNKLALLEAEKTSLQDQRDKENVIYQQKMVQFAQVQSSFKQMQNTFVTGLSTMQTAAQEKVTAINKLLAQMQAALDKMGVLSGTPQATPITGQTVPKFANGGVVDSPTLAMIGEGGYSEAVVPLPDGRRIPVQMSGEGGGKQVTVNMNFGDVNIAKEVDAENFFSRMEERLTRAIQLQQLGSIA